MIGKPAEPECKEGILTGWRTLRQLYWKISRDADASLKPWALGFQELEGLLVLSDGAPHPLTEISQHLGVTPAAVTELVDRLERKGLARRELTSSDRRLRCAKITPKGRRAVRCCMRAYARSLEQVFHNVDTSGALLRALDGIVRRQKRKQE